MQYTVTAVIQSEFMDGGDDLVEVQWYRGVSLAIAMSAMAQAAVQYEPEHTRVPEAVRPVTLSVRMDVRDLPPCSHCGAALIGEDCPNYGNGAEHA